MEASAVRAVPTNAPAPVSAEAAVAAVISGIMDRAYKKPVAEATADVNPNRRSSTQFVRTLARITPSCSTSAFPV